MDCNLRAVHSCHPDKSPLHNESQPCILKGSKAILPSNTKENVAKCVSVSIS